MLANPYVQLFIAVMLAIMLTFLLFFKPRKARFQRMRTEYKGTKEKADQLFRELAITISPEFFLGATVGCALVFFLLCVLVFDNLAFGIVSLVIIPGLAALWLWGKQRRLKTLLEYQFGAFAHTFHMRLTRGASHIAAFEDATKTVGNPLYEKLEKVVLLYRQKEVKDFLEALKAGLEWIGEPLYRDFVEAFMLQEEYGGNLIEVAEDISAQINKRITTKKHIRAQVAQAKKEIQLILVIIYGILAALFLIKPYFIVTLFTTVTGWVVLALAAAMQGVAIWFMSKKIKSLEAMLP